MKYKKISIGDTFIAYPKYTESIYLKKGYRHQVTAIDKKHGEVFAISIPYNRMRTYWVRRYMGDVFHV